MSGPVTLDCFCAGTRIRLDTGDRPVEQLLIGDHVVTASGALARIRWIGWRHVDLARHPQRDQVQPVRIEAGVFGPGLPQRDLLLSPEHALFLEEALVPVRALLGCNGIALDRTLDAMTYYHIELDWHDIVLAENLPCESWLDTGNRWMFQNAPVAALHFAAAGPDNDAAARAWAERACAPLLTSGTAVEAIRTRLGRATERPLRPSRPRRGRP